MHFFLACILFLVLKDETFLHKNLKNLAEDPEKQRKNSFPWNQFFLYLILQEQIGSAGANTLFEFFEKKLRNRYTAPGLFSQKK